MSDPADSPTAERGPTHRSSPGLALALLVTLTAGGRAVAHPGGGASGAGHFVADAIGLLVAAFLGYLVFSFARRVLYPRVRRYL